MSERPGPRLHPPSPAMIVACVALAFSLAGAGWASGLLPRNSVGTPQLQDGAVDSAKVRNGSLRAADFQSTDVPRGPQGAQGPPGPVGQQGPKGLKGDPGDPATVRWALVRADGTILAQSGGISIANHPQPGWWILGFGGAVTNRPILSAPSFAETGDRGSVIVGPCAGPPQSYAACPTPNNDATHVWVFTRSATNKLNEDHSFYVAVLG